MPYVRIRPIKVLGEGRVGRGERERESQSQGLQLLEKKTLTQALIPTVPDCSR
jgi:hypothetical protein